MAPAAESPTSNTRSLFVERFNLQLLLITICWSSNLQPIFVAKELSPLTEISFTFKPSPESASSSKPNERVNGTEAHVIPRINARLPVKERFVRIGVSKYFVEN